MLEIFGGPLPECIPVDGERDRRHRAPNYPDNPRIRENNSSLARRNVGALILNNLFGLRARSVGVLTRSGHFNLLAAAFNENFPSTEGEEFSGNCAPPRIARAHYELLRGHSSFFR